MRDLRALMDRADFVFRNAPPCPRCGETMQIQVITYLEPPAEWRCRTCKHKFVHEPTQGLGAIMRWQDHWLLNWHIAPHIVVRIMPGLWFPAIYVQRKKKYVAVVLPFCGITFDYA